MASRMDPCRCCAFSLYSLLKLPTESSDHKIRDTVKRHSAFRRRRAEGARSRGRLGVTLMQVRSPRRASGTAQNHAAPERERGLDKAGEPLLDRQIVG
jgi:hypothetical protein